MSQSTEITSQHVVSTLKKLLSGLEITDITIKAALVDGEHHYTIFTSDSAYLIGNKGETLHGLELLLKQILSRQGTVPPLRLDVNNYRHRQDERFTESIQSICQNLTPANSPHHLPPMTSYERRLVHQLVQNFSHLETSSVGEGRERHVIISVTATEQ